MEKTVKNIEKVVISVQKLTQINSTGVENVRQISPFYDKQSQFTNCPITSNSLRNKDLCNFRLSDESQIQTQFKPKQTQFWANIKGSKAKQTQFKAETNPIYFAVFCFQPGSLCFYALISFALFHRNERHYSLAYFARLVLKYPCCMSLTKKPTKPCNKED